jgi:putative addiction module killer protein/probable addiction module antidote protein
VYEVQSTAVFDAWLEELGDLTAQDAISDRIARVESGLLGDRKSVGDRISELRINVGQGYRLYYTMRGRALVLLLCGGSKKDQRSDIRKAEAMVRAMNKEKKSSSASRVRDRQSAYTAKPEEGEESGEFSFTEDELKISRFDVAKYLGRKSSQLYLLRRAFADGHSAHIANALGAVARARGLSNMERATGIKRQTLNKSLSPKGNPTLATLMAVLGALKLRLEVVEEENAGALAG